MTTDTIPTTGPQAALLYTALGIAVDETRRQLEFKRPDVFRSAALKSMLAQFEAERARLATAFPMLLESI